MHDALIEKYAELMASLATLPDEIDDAQQKMSELQFEIAELEKVEATREAALLGQVEGKNAEQRKANLTLLKEKDASYRRIASDLAGLHGELQAVKDTVDHRQRQYGAVCYQTRLHAAFVNYLANAGAPVPATLPEIDFGKNSRPPASSLASPSADDAAAIGL
jgi:chromosome segregation ATPase